MSMYYMGKIAGMTEEAKKEVSEYLRNNADGVTLGTLQDGGVHLTMMGLLQGASADEVYMQANRTSQKVLNIEKNPCAEVAVSNRQGYVILECEAKVVDSPDLKASKWEPWMVEYHSDGATSNDYVLLQFTVQQIRAMI